MTIWELISLLGAKTHFGKIALKWRISGMKKKFWLILCCCSFWSYLVIDTLSTLIWPSEPQFCESFCVVGRKMARNSCKMAIYKSENLIFFSYKIEKKTETKQNSVLCRRFWANYVLNVFESPNCSSEPELCESFYVVGRKMTKNGQNMAINLFCPFCLQ